MDENTKLIKESLTKIKLTLVSLNANLSILSQDREPSIQKHFQEVFRTTSKQLQELERMINNIKLS